MKPLTFFCIAFNALFLLLPFNVLGGSNSFNWVRPANGTCVGGDLSYWRLDGMNAPPTNDWNMGFKAFLNVPYIRFNQTGLTPFEGLYFYKGTDDVGAQILYSRFANQFILTNITNIISNLRVWTSSGVTTHPFLDADPIENRMYLNGTIVLPTRDDIGTNNPEIDWLVDGASHGRIGYIVHDPTAFTQGDGLYIVSNHSIYIGNLGRARITYFSGNMILDPIKGKSTDSIMFNDNDSLYFGTGRFGVSDIQIVYNASRDQLLFTPGVLASPKINITIPVRVFTQYVGRNLTINGNITANNICYKNGSNCPPISGVNYLPTSFGVKSGTLLSGNVTSVYYPEDAKNISVREATGASPLTLDINFTGITSFNNVIMRIYYLGSPGHEIRFGLYNYDTNAYEYEYGSIFGQTGFAYININVYDVSNHVSGSGKVSFRFDHVQNGIASHILNVDYINLVSGVTTIINTDHDSLTNRNSVNNHPWAFDKGGSKVATGSFNMGQQMLLNVSQIKPQISGLKIGSSASIDKIGFYGVTPVGQQAAATELFTSLTAYGLYPSSATTAGITTLGTIQGGALTTSSTKPTLTLADSSFGDEDWTFTADSDILTIQNRDSPKNVLTMGTGGAAQSSSLNSTLVLGSKARSFNLSMWYGSTQFCCGINSASVFACKSGAC